MGGQVNNIDGHDGYINCPPAEEICPKIVAIDKFYRQIDRVSDGKFINEMKPTIHSTGENGPVTYEDFVKAFNEANQEKEEELLSKKSGVQYDKDALAEDAAKIEPKPVVKNFTMTIYIREDYKGSLIVGIGKVNSKTPTKYELENGLDGDGYALYTVKFLAEKPPSSQLQFEMPEDKEYEVYVYMKDCNIRGGVERHKYTTSSK